MSHFADKFLGGSHDFKFGVQYNSGGSDYVTGYNDYIYTYGTETLYGYTQLPYHQAGNVKSLGVFFDDTFRVGSRLSFNVGLRYDNSQASFPSFPAARPPGQRDGRSPAAPWTTCSRGTRARRASGFN